MTDACWQVAINASPQLFARLAWRDKLDRKSGFAKSVCATFNLGKRALYWALRRRAVHAAITVSFLGCPALLFSQTDEIQVYDAAIADPGVFNLMIHTNFTPIGRKTPDFPGAIVANHSFQTTAEWAYGVTDWFEQGLYLPVTSPYSENHGSTINGFKLRELFVRPHADEHKFFYGVNFEFSVNALYWEPKRV